jgi:quinol monooxygenase YgiN
MVSLMDIEKFKSRTPECIRVLAYFYAKAGRSEELEKVLLSLVEPTRNEAGNIAYILHRNENNSSYFVFDEIWTSKDALSHHLKMPYITSLSKRIENLVEGEPKIELFREIAP